MTSFRAPYINDERKQRYTVTQPLLFCEAATAPIEALPVSQCQHCFHETLRTTVPVFS